ncbi:hypothetical protein [Pseudanabaena sp. ABRG5-3]|jgi:hypothetical protein|uniref:hypothetical protein n=1 Tax=Pseudanabaena sp. ABRG5-3 TaxID=685565 RepID=UPI000DC6EF62|nr:hypothetical protein [Pseudanabaena sp. ABRG5-3]BBC23052.1 hypothetical protein ABRG53_0795 [Pseudanabaena sp. ABRG5-3]
MQANPVSKPTTSQSGYQTSQSGYQASVPVTVYRELAAELQSTQAKLSFFQLQNEQLTKQNQMLLQEFEAIAQATDRVQSILTQSNLPESKLSEVLAGIRASSQINPAPSRSNPQPQGRPPAAKPRTADKPATQASPRRAAVQQTTNAIQEAISRARQLATDSTPQSSNEPMLGEALYYDRSFASFDAPAPTPVSAPTPKVLPKLEIREEISSRPLRHESIEEANESTGLSGWVLTLTIVAIVLTSFGAGYLLMRPFVK